MRGGGERKKNHHLISRGAFVGIADRGRSCCPKSDALCCEKSPKRGLSSIRWHIKGGFVFATSAALTVVLRDTVVKCFVSY